MPDSERQSKQKLKLLYLIRMFEELTDDSQGLTMPQIIEGLAEQGITAERKALYRDIDTLKSFGFDIGTLRTRPVQYALMSRTFSLTELTLLVDAVQCSRFLTKSKSDALVRSIKTLGSKNQAKSLTKRLYVEGRIKMQNESVFHNVDAIQDALMRKRKVAFRYFKYDVEKNQKLQHDGDLYLETPVQLVYVDEYYYLIAWNDKHEGFTHYRVDRMCNIMVSDERSTKNPQIATFDVNEYGTRVFGMFSGEPTGAQLLVDEEVMGAVIDRFGKDVTSTKVDDTHARVHVMVMEAPTFYGWLAQFGSHMKIEKPSTLVKGYTEYLAGILKDYE